MTTQLDAAAVALAASRRARGRRAEALVHNLRTKLKPDSSVSTHDKFGIERRGYASSYVRPCCVTVFVDCIWFEAAAARMWPTEIIGGCSFERSRRIATCHPEWAPAPERSARCAVGQLHQAHRSTTSRLANPRLSSMHTATTASGDRSSTAYSRASTAMGRRRNMASIWYAFDAMDGDW